MNNIWKVKDVEKDFVTIEYSDDCIKLTLKSIDISEYNGNFFKNVIPILTKKYKDEDFGQIKNIKNFIDNDILIINKKNLSYLIVKIKNIPIIDKNTVKILIRQKREIETDFDIPAVFRIDGRTTKLKFNEIEKMESNLLNIDTLYLIANKLLDNDENVYRDYKEYFADKTRQATASANGYIKQSLIALYFIFYKDNYKIIKNIKIEGEKEDIEIEYRNNTFDFIQVKIAENPKDETDFDKERFKKGIEGLKITNEKIKRDKTPTNLLIYASNTVYQPLERLTNLLKGGYLFNFTETCKKDIYYDEKEFLKKDYDLDDDFINKFAISRVNDKFLEIVPTIFYDEYNQISENLKTTNSKIKNFCDLKDLCLISEIKRKKIVNIFEIAYIFLKNTKNSNDFNQQYENHLQEINESSIENFIADENLEEYINNYGKQPYLIELFLEMKKDFEQQNILLKLKNLKSFIDRNYEKLKDMNILSLKNMEKNKIDLIYKYLLYTIFVKRDDIKKIREEFELEEL